MIGDGLGARDYEQVRNNPGSEGAWLCCRVTMRFRKADLKRNLSSSFLNRGRKQGDSIWTNSCGRARDADRRERLLILTADRRHDAAVAEHDLVIVRAV